MPKLHEIEMYYTYEMITDILEIMDVKQALDIEAHQRSKNTK